MSVWYLMFQGSSPDGRGDCDYCGRTTSKKMAHQHFMNISRNPYSTGKVLIVNDFAYREATELDFAEQREESV